VAPDHLRFDFTHYSGLKAEAVRDLEWEINEKVLSNLIVQTKETSMEQAVSEGAMALFGEKYGDQVRMVTIGEYSKELCGGTHCSSTGEVGAFLVLRESSTAAGIRRIEAVTGNGALEYVQQERSLLLDLTSTLKVSRDELLERIRILIEHNKKLEKEIERLKTQSMLGSDSQELSAEIQWPPGKAYLRVFPDAEADQLGTFVDEKARAGKYLIVVAASVSSSSVAVRAGEGEDAVAVLKKVLAPAFGGGGGGRKDFAKGGLKRLKELSAQESFEQMKKLMEEYRKS
jgi:alanyl-tRNA synthetase